MRGLDSQRGFGKVFESLALREFVARFRVSPFVGARGEDGRMGQDKSGRRSPQAIGESGSRPVACADASWVCSMQ